MECPVCKTHNLKPAHLEKNLLANGCQQCGGHWISYQNYWTWLEQQAPDLPEKPFAEVSFNVDDTREASLCPDCGRILLKYRVGHGIDFFLDHCNGCGGIWLDKNEWEVLKSRNLHDRLHRIFTTSWQKQIRAEEMKIKLENFYAHKFGEKDYRELKRIKRWIDRHHQRKALLVYLNDESPYEI